MPRTGFWLAPIDPDAGPQLDPRRPREPGRRGRAGPRARTADRSCSRRPRTTLAAVHAADPGRDRAAGVHQLADRRRAARLRGVRGRDRAVRRGAGGSPAPGRGRVARRAAPVRDRARRSCRRSPAPSSGFAGAAAAVAILASAQGAPVDIVLGLALLQPAALGADVRARGAGGDRGRPRHPSRRRPAPPAAGRRGGRDPGRPDPRLAAADRRALGRDRARRRGNLARLRPAAGRARAGGDPGEPRRCCRHSCEGWHGSPAARRSASGSRRSRWPASRSGRRPS